MGDEMTGFNKYKKPKRPDDPFDNLSSYIPKTLHARLKEISKEKDQPVARLVAMAVDNEFETQAPFTYRVEMPDTPYEEYAYAGEARKIYEFLKKSPNGMAPELIMLCRHEIGVSDKASLMSGLRELLEKEMVEVFTTKGGGKNRIEERIRALDESGKAPAKFKKVEGSMYMKRIRDEDVER